MRKHLFYKIVGEIPITAAIFSATKDFGVFKKGDEFAVLPGVDKNIYPAFDRLPAANKKEEFVTYVDGVGYVSDNCCCCLKFERYERVVIDKDEDDNDRS